MHGPRKKIAKRNLTNEAGSIKITYTKEMNDRTESLPSSTSKHVFPQAHEMVFIRGQGEQAPLPKKTREMLTEEPRRFGH